METKELIITIPEGYEINKSESTFEKIVFRKKDIKPRSWEEYCGSESGFDGTGINWIYGGIQTTGIHHRGKAIVPNNFAAPFIAMMQLISLRQEWIGDWQPVWDGEIYQYCIIVFDNEYVVEDFSIHHHPLSFPTKEMAEDFMHCFKDLLNTAKPLI